MDSAARDVHLPVAAQDSLADLTRLSERAEQLGYDRVWMPETWGRDAVTTLAAIAERTDEIGIGTSIANVYSRSPALLGQTAATLQELSDGRFRLGLGPSGPILIAGWHGVDFDRPLRRTREYVEIVRNVLAGEPLEYDGEVFQLSGFRLRSSAPAVTPPLDVAGMGPKSVELAGRFGDGWHAIVMSRAGVADRIGDFERGTDLGDRSRDDQRVMLSLPCCALSDGERARDLVRQHLAFYVGGMGTFYRDALARQGYEDVAREISERWANRDRDGAAAAIGEGLLDDLAAAGTPEHAREQFAAFAAIEGLDAVSVSFPRGASVEEIEATLDALAPS